MTASHVEIYKLANGLTVATSAMPAASSIAVGFWINVGTRHEPTGANGVAHLVEHMLFKGTERRSALEIASALENVGGSMNAYTSREQTAYYARVLPQDLPLAIDILADMIQHSTLAEEELAREREVIVQEIGEMHDQPGDFMEYELHGAAFAGHNFGRSILGDAAQIAAMPRAEVAAYIRQHYHAGNIILAAAGPIDHAEIVKLAEAHCAGLPPAPAASDSLPTFQPAQVRIQRDIEQVTLALLWPGPSYKAKNSWAYDVAAQILGDGFSSRLFQEVREKRGLVYSIYASATNYSDCGTFEIQASATPDHCAEVLTVTASVLKGFAADLTEAEIARAKAQLKANILMSNDNVATRADRIATHLQVFGRVVPPEEMAALYDKVTRAEIEAVIAEIIAAPLATGLIGPLANIGDIPDFTAALAA